MERKLNFVLIAAKVVAFDCDFEFAVRLGILDQYQGGSGCKCLQLLPWAEMTPQVREPAEYRRARTGTRFAQRRPRRLRKMLLERPRRLSKKHLQQRLPCALRRGLGAGRWAAEEQEKCTAENQRKKLPRPGHVASCGCW